MLLAVQPFRAYAETPLTMVVMDPLALPLSCACVDGVGQRRYEALAKGLSKELHRQVDLVYEESLQLALRRAPDGIDIVVGKRSTVMHDAEATGLSFHPVASLTDSDGKTTVRGAILVRADDLAQSVEDLKGRQLAIGPAEHAECHVAVKELFSDRLDEVSMVVHDSIESAVYAFDDGEVDAVVVSGFLPPLLVGCGKLQKDSFRIIGTTTPKAFVQAFVSSNFDAATRHKIAGAMVQVTQDLGIRVLLESQSGFTSTGWPDWRGPGRAGRYDQLPLSLSKQPEVIWRAEVTGPAMAGISATENIVMVADKNSDFDEDIFRAFDALTGQSLWTIRYPAVGKMDYTNTPRATPVIVDNQVILQGAFGDLVCASITDGTIRWQRNLVKDFGGELPSWGYCVPPLVVDQSVIVAPGGKEHAVIALRLSDGKQLWSTRGHAAAYAPMIHATFGGREQVIGYDSASLAGWDLKSGERIWELIPPDNTDFNVGTPVPLRNGLLVATENNATRVYEFDEQGKLMTEPLNVNHDCAPDTCTPVVSGDRVFCSAYGELFCLDAANDYRTLWSEADDRFYDHTCLIASDERVLLWSSSCDLLLLDSRAEGFKIISDLQTNE